MSESARSTPGSQPAGETKVSPQAPARRAGATQAVPQGTPWIAVLEDDEDQGALLCHWIRSILSGAALQWFRRADELVDHMSTAPSDAPCLLLCDYELKDGDALSVMRRLAAGRGAQAFVVVVVSAHTDPARREAALEAGAAAWLTKPLSRDELQRAIRAVTDGWPAPHPAPNPTPHNADLLRT